MAPEFPFDERTLARGLISTAAPQPATQPPYPHGDEHSQDGPKPDDSGEYERAKYSRYSGHYYEGERSEYLGEWVTSR